MPLGELRLPLRTPRLVLRPLVESDAEAMASYRSIPEVCEFVPFQPMSAADVRARIEGWSCIELVGDDAAAILGVELDGRVVGDVMLRVVSIEHGVGEVGYVLHPDVEGQGIATEAAHGVLHLAFEDLGLRRMIARVDVENRPSSRLLERLGMRLEAHLVENEWFKGRLSDELDYAMLRREWDAQHAQPTSVAPWCPPTSA